MPDTETINDKTRRAQAAAVDQRFGEAAGICTDILRREPAHASALALQGMLANQAGDLQQALKLVSRAIEIDGSVAMWHANLASLHRLNCDMEPALTAAYFAKQLAPENPEVLVALALVQIDLGRPDEAITLLLRAIGLAPDHANAHLALGQVLLQSGQMEPGWREYEWRNQTEMGKLTIPAMKSPAWNGMPLPGQTVLAIGDQGFGDTFLFARYLPLLRELCGEIVIGCSPQVAPLLRGMRQGEVFTEWELVPSHVAHVRLSSAPYVLGDQTISDIPCYVPYLFAEEAGIAAWRERISVPDSIIKVGIAWSGRPTYPNDRRRSLHINRLAQLWSLQDRCAFFPLQPAPVGSRDLWSGGVNDPGDFAETAGLIANLDLVISVDTAAAHLAGALGKPVWLLLSQSPHMLWINGRDTSPWYPFHRLFRQPAPGDWGTPILALFNELCEWVPDRQRAPSF